MKHIITTFD